MASDRAVAAVARASKLDFRFAARALARRRRRRRAEKIDEELGVDRGRRVDDYSYDEV